MYKLDDVVAMSRRERTLALVAFPILDALADLDEGASAAARLRSEAFHEAGHMWAAHRCGLAAPEVVAGDLGAMDMEALDPLHRPFVAAAGLLSEVIVAHNDVFAVDWADFDATADPRAILECAAHPDVTPRCLRPTCTAANEALAEEDWGVQVIEVLASNWTRIGRLANALIEGVHPSFEVEWDTRG